MTGEFNFFNHPAFQPEEEPSPEREIIRVIIFASRAAVQATIRESHVRGFRTIDTWSPLLPTPDPQKVMAISTHYRPTNG
ncbi:MAG: hypothetical protein KME15_15480 [Drouetiella hepatica Uher 2000/2452]|jgi:hypothetical protein|uniref:Uncharacterized protein n=1 Tax=Drouetiella hepatica Uher 2000/2452 TaxID=904376 RepID=A0A951QE34_9CYAN|nr:hypothetical protein [Drouetiella hepatica Uher 2000/2452]